MFGLGFGEIFLIGAVVVSALSALVVFDVLKKGLGRGGNKDFESRVLDELEVLRLRMDAINDRLDGLAPSPTTEKALLHREVDGESL